MIVYNLTNKVNPEVEAEWIRWQKDEHIPDILATGQFTEHRFYRLLEHDDEDGITFIIQYFAPDMDHYRRYVDEFSPPLRKKAMERWGNKFIVFRTLMQVVN